MSSRVCTHCGSSDIDTDPTRGDSVCTNCGSVLEDQIIVSEVQFQENAIGGSSAVGQFISSEGIKSHTFGGTFKHGFGRESRTVTFENGRKKIQHLGNQLKLNQHCIDTAFNFFKMAVTKRLTRGRKTAYVIAACLYLVCRTEGTAHMLLDFSDILQVNVYTLGKTYLQLSKELCINIPAIDPCLYIPRFAHKLEFGDKTHEVSMTALRLVQRMKRDWMHTGRRPSGLCGAALLVSARVHEFCRTTKNIIKVVKVCEATIRKRLTEFEDTASGKLTIDEFSRIDLEEEQDPPSFTKGKQKAKLAQLEEQNKMPDIANEISSLQEKIEKSLEPKKHHGGIWASYAKETRRKDDVELASEFVEQEIIEEALSSEVDSDAERRTRSENRTGSENLEKIKRSPHPACRSDSDSDAGSRPGPRPTAASLGIKESIELGLSAGQATDCPDDVGELDLGGIDDEELERFILNDNEVKAKTEMWMLANADYLQEQKEKAEKEAKEKELNADKPEKKRRRPKKKSTTQASSAKEAIEQMLMEKKMSNKINYEVLQGLNKAPDPVVKFKAKEEIISPGSSLFKRPNPFLPREIKSEEPTSKKLKVEPVHEVVVESGPVQYDTKDELEYEEEDVEEDEEHVSAAQLMGHTEEVPGYGDDLETYDDDEY